MLSRPRYARRPKADPENNGGRGVTGHRHGHRSRSLLDPSTLVPQVSAALPLVIKFARDSPLEGDGFELSVPRQRRHPSATANRLSRHHFPRDLGLRFAPKASTPSRKSSELPRKVTGSSQRSPLHAAGTVCLHFGKCACKQAATRTSTVIGGVSGSKRQTRPPESHRFLAKVPAPRRRDPVPAFRKMRVQASDYSFPAYKRACCSPERSCANSRPPFSDWLALSTALTAAR